MKNFEHDLEVIVTRICECKETEEHSKFICEYEIERAVESDGEDIYKFIEFTGEISFRAFKHCGSRTMTQKGKRMDYVRWIEAEHKIEITASEFENAEIEIYFKYINGEGEEKESSVSVITDFTY